MHLIASLLIILHIVGLDQIVKHWAVEVLAAKGTIPVIEGVFHLTYAENTGAAFSIFQGQRWLLVAITVVVVGILLYVLIKDVFDNRVSRIALAFILGGAIGNMVDRIRSGFVVDMFEFRFIDFAVFNVADTFLTIGAILMIVYVFVADRQQKKIGPPQAGEQDDE